MGLMSTIRKVIGRGDARRPKATEHDEERQRAEEAMQAMGRRR